VWGKIRQRSVVDQYKGKGEKMVIFKSKYRKDRSCQKKKNIMRRHLRQRKGSPRPRGEKVIGRKRSTSS